MRKPILIAAGMLAICAQASVRSTLPLVNDMRKADSAFQLSHSWLEPGVASPGLTEVQDVSGAQHRFPSETCTLTVNVDYNPEDYADLRAIVFLGGGSVAMPDGYSDDMTEFTWDLEPGVYDMFFCLTDDLENFTILYEQGLSVEEDCNYSFSVSEATVSIDFTDILPDGSEARLNTLTEDGTPVGGNCNQVNRTITIASDKWGGISIYMVNEWWAEQNGEPAIAGKGNVRMNPNDDLLFFRESMIPFKDGVAGILEVQHGGADSVNVANDPSDFTSIMPDVASTPLSSGDPVIEGYTPFAFSAVIIDEGYFLSQSFFSGFDTEVERNAVHTCMAGNYTGCSYHPVPTFIEDAPAVSYGLPVIQNAGNEGVYAGLNNAAACYPFGYTESGTGLFADMVNPSMSVPVAGNPLWNYGCPVFVSVPTVAPWGYFWDYSWVGRLNENRQGDKALTQAAMLIDGAAPTEDQLEQMQWGEVPEGAIVYLEYLDRNVTVDGMEGRNFTKLEFDSSAADNQPPTLQNLRVYSSADRKLNDRFSNPDDGYIEFFAGDFTYGAEYSPYFRAWYSETAPATVTAGYAPYGLKDYSPVDVTAVPTRDFMPGFGNCYRIGLEDVARKSETGWFDLRIKLTDAAGNWQEQTLSPVFYISSLIGTDGVDALERDIPEAEGPCAGEWFTISGIKLSGKPDAPGMYVVRCGATISKIMI